jgi:DNA-binding transcriptional regulator YiaG
VSPPKREKSYQGSSQMIARKADTSELALRILKLRKLLELSQTALGSRLHYSAMAVSRWEAGTQEPPAKCLIQLGNLSGEPECWWFWGRAGLRRADISRKLLGGRSVLHKAKFLDFEIVVAESGKKRARNSRKIKLIAIPVLPIHAATRGQTGDDDLDLGQVSPDEMIAAPSIWCPNPVETHCLRVRGSSMNPLIDDGDIVALDSSQTDPDELNCKIVVAWHPEHGLSLSRFLRVDGLQLLESENRKYEPIVFGKDRNWRIVGKVLWWIRSAP